jgi:hypothetical protein
MPSWSNASPVVPRTGQLVFVSSEPDQIHGVDRDTGNILWTRSVADVSDKSVDTHETNGYTSPTPVVDGDRLFHVFGSGVVSAHTAAGVRLWARVVERPAISWGHSASPALGGGCLIVHLGDLYGLDPATGKQVWHTTSKLRHGSPVVTSIGGVDVVITPSGDAFRAADGQRLASELGSAEFSTPVVQDGVVYFIEKRAVAVRLPERLGPVFESTQLWEARLQGSRHYASPLIHDGLVYAISREERFTILDAATGAVLFESTLDLGEGSNSIYASVTLAGGRIFVSAESGTTVVLEPGPTYRELARNDYGRSRSTPVFLRERMYVRTYDYLYCFASPPAPPTTE